MTFFLISLFFRKTLSICVCVCVCIQRYMNMCMYTHKCVYIYMYTHISSYILWAVYPPCCFIGWNLKHWALEWTAETVSHSICRLSLPKIITSNCVTPELSENWWDGKSHLQDLDLPRTPMFNFLPLIGFPWVEEVKGNGVSYWTMQTI